MRSYIFAFAAVLACASLTEAQVKPRIVIAFDTSGSMALDLDGTPTFGDGVLTGCSDTGGGVLCGSNCTAGIDTDCDGEPNDSRIAVAKEALRNMILAFGDVEFALARFSQDQSTNESCLRVDNFECNSFGPYVTSYGNPQCNTGPTIPNGSTCPFNWPSLFPAACRPGSGSNPDLREWAGGSPTVCTNYGGTCDGGNFLTTFPDVGPFAGLENTQALLRWIDDEETNPRLGVTTGGNWCDHRGTGDCELRPEGATPLAGLLGSVGSNLAPIIAGDSFDASCRGYSVILLTDGVESCGGNPEAAAASLLGMGIQTYVIGLAVGGGAEAQLNDIATAGGTDAGDPGGDTAFFANDPDTLSAGLADIVRRSLRFETCDGADNDCDLAIDEGFTLFCDRPGGVTTPSLCTEPAETLCDGMDDDCDGATDEGLLNACGACGATPPEVCDGLDNNCNGIIDEGDVCSGCVPSSEICDGLDNDCDTRIDEDLERICGTDVGACSTGTQTCSAGAWGTCTGTTPTAESCNGIDDDCDGVIDGITRPCGTDEGTCSPGTETCVSGDWDGMCIGEVGPRGELCDDLDNDCDGRTDEGDPGGGAVCGSSIGACDPGVLRCSGGSLVCSGETGPGAESCNAIDDDCDGTTDESVPTDGACGSAVGECREGVRTCVGGSFTCVGGRGPVDELCDGLDNDCDGRTDEGGLGGEVCGTATGACDTGLTVCRGGSLVCEGGSGPGVETCNAIDDDCDGLTDEGNPEGGGACGDTAEGECELGALACDMGSLVCRGATGPTTERCDGLDNDCDGSIDEGDPEGGAACGDDTGECEAGTTACVGGELICEGGVGPEEEVCDGLDNDCDGVEDEGLGVGAPCGSDSGECSPGVNVCRDGMLVCEGAIDPTGETCNGLDDDCDGVIDESLPLGEACGSAEGLCMEGATQCIDGREVCVGEVPPAREGCDCEDNDCDGSVDEDPELGSLCPEGSACVECACSLPCQRSEFGFTCPSGKTPFVDGEECFCVTPRCEAEACGEETLTRDEATLCSPDEDTPGCVCKNNECTFPCDGVVCSDGTVCRPDTGRCVEDSCRGLGCPDGEVCNPATGACVEDPCVAVDCAADEACREGVCEASCADIECDDGEVCRSGACEVDVCAVVSCDSGTVCDPEDGSCVEDMCGVDVRCPTGSFCDPVTGDCEPDPCDTLHCPEGQLCEDGECVREEEMMPDAGVDAGPGEEVDAGPGSGGAPGDRILAAGGGGCACTVPAGSPEETPWAPFAALGLLGLVGWRRRRGGARVRGAVRGRAARVLALLGIGAAGLLGGGCDVDPFCTNCVDAGPDTGPIDSGVDAGVDAGVRDAGPPDTGIPDAGPDGCLEVEICNEADDDCDGEIDEGIDLQTDVNNCGACGAECAPARAFGACVDGTCTIGTCDVGWFDLNGDLEDGCEYRCLPTAEDDALCDLRDNDCDGEVDEDVLLDEDPTNCGSCGRNCRFAHVVSPRCDTGTCTFDRETDCETDFYDIDEVVENGCEYACTPADPATEVCNGRDDDCDGMVDEGDPEGGATCGTDEGLCSTGVERCVDGALVCFGAVTPDTEACNGDDDDCDGSVDEGNPGGGGSCGTDVGACLPGTRQCMGGSLVCVGETTGGAEECNTLDDDCDGSVDEGNPEGGASCGSDVGACSAGSEVCVGGALICSGATGPSVEICNGADDDCDGSTDETFDFDNDLNNCGDCGTVCSFSRGVAICDMGSCELAGCETGWVDEDGSAANGCEYECDFVGAEICNGRDDDCDRVVDEGLTAPSNFCNPNGVCAGTSATCGGMDGWECVYPGDYEETEVSCDGEDNDCDGAIDEPFPTLGTVCSNGVGACQRFGTVECAPAGDTVQCNAPPAGASAAEACNALDDDCDGAVDENPGSLIPTVSVGGVDVMIYEASRPDATDAAQGTIDGYACAQAGVLPWTNVTWGEAQAACQALGAGWDLCDESDWQNACEGAASCDWSYAASCTSSQPLTCNGEEYDASGAAGDQDALFPTASGTFAECYSVQSGGGVIYDLSGNVKEWTRTERGSPDVHAIRGGSYNNVEDGRRCDFDFTVGDDNFAFLNTGFRCCRY